MLQFIFGRAGSGKTYKIQEIICEHLKNNTKKLMIIVPEQSSFDTEKAMLDLLGEKESIKVQVMTFTRLIDLVSREVGGFTRNRINKGDRNLLMSLAIDEVVDQLKIFYDQSGKMEFIDMMVSALSEFKMCNITDKNLFDASHLVNEPVLKGKIKETALILQSYEALLYNTYTDPLDDLTRLAKTLSIYNFFNEYTVMIDGFEGFTIQQLSIIELILKQCNNCYITLCTDKNVFSDDKFSLFAPINKTAIRILNLAKKNSVKIKVPIYLEKSWRFKSDGLKYLENQVFRLKKKPYFQNVDDVYIYNGNTQYDEADFISRTIKRLVCEQGYKYGNFAVITRNDEVYKGIMDISFEKYNIPYFMDRREDIDAKPLMHLVLSTLEIINKNYSSESIFRFLKTGLSGFDFDDISILENYVLFWGITGKRWLSDFTSNPDGYGEMSPESSEKLLKINNIRKNIIEPIKKLKEKTVNTTGDVITESLYGFLMEINLLENLKYFYNNLNDSMQNNLAEEQLRLWDLLVDILDRMNVILKGKYMSTGKYAELLRLVINSNDIAFIPKGADEVIFSSIDRFRAQNIKVVFLLGAVEGEFPRTPASTGIFNDSQRRQLISMGMNLYDSVEGLSINERFLAYKTMTIPSEKLYITWSCATTLGGVKAPSSIVKETRAILPKVYNIDDISQGLDDEIWAKEPAFEMCAKHWRDKSRFSQTLIKYFAEDNDYKEKLYSINIANTKAPFKFKNNERASELFGKNIKVSASQVEKYYLCKFSYFCKYGLFAKERKKARFDALEYGNVMHFIFEKMFKTYDTLTLFNLSNKEISIIIKDILNSYIEVNLGGWKEKTKRFQYLFNSVIKTALPVVTNMLKELSQSEFLPTKFEMEISPKSEIKPLILKLEDDSFISVEGKIDRVDVMKKENKLFVRVIDYKTGHKEFILSDLLYGLNLQMLIYLETICKNLKKEYEEVLPAGVLYLPSVSTVVNADRDENIKKIEKDKMKKLRMNGLILDDPEVIYGMEKDATGVFIPVVMKDGQPKNKDFLANVAQMGAIMKHIDKLIMTMAKELKSGNISPYPVKGECDACEFCEYKTVCGEAKNVNVREIKKFNRDEFFKELVDKEGGGEIG